MACSHQTPINVARLRHRSRSLKPTEPGVPRLDPDRRCEGAFKVMAFCAFSPVIYRASSYEHRSNIDVLIRVYAKTMSWSDEGVVNLLTTLCSNP